MSRLERCLALAALRRCCGLFGLGDRRFGTQSWARPIGARIRGPGRRLRRELTPGYGEIAALRLRRKTRVSRVREFKWVIQMGRDTFRILRGSATGLSRADFPARSTAPLFTTWASGIAGTDYASPW